MAVRLGPSTFDFLSRDSALFHPRPQMSTELAVNLAVNGRGALWTFDSLRKHRRSIEIHTLVGPDCENIPQHS
jgi:hypothetical protein